MNTTSLRSSFLAGLGGVFSHGRRCRCVAEDIKKHSFVYYFDPSLSLVNKVKAFMGSSACKCPESWSPAGLPAGVYEDLHCTCETQRSFLDLRTLGADPKGIRTQAPILTTGRASNHPARLVPRPCRGSDHDRLSDCQTRCGAGTRMATCSPMFRRSPMPTSLRLRAASPILRAGSATPTTRRTSRRYLRQSSAPCALGSTTTAQEPSRTG